jgi:hypothetical protein
MLIRLVVRVVGIGIGVSIASLVWVSMGSGYNYVSIVVGVCVRAIGGGLGNFCWRVPKIRLGCVRLLWKTHMHPKVRSICYISATAPVTKNHSRTADSKQKKAEQAEIPVHYATY